jgi:hypothetical protein
LVSDIPAGDGKIVNIFLQRRAAFADRRVGVEPISTTRKSCRQVFFVHDMSLYILFICNIYPPNRVHLVWSVDIAQL